MLMRTDPFREMDRLAQQMLATASRPAPVPIDAYRDGDHFVVEFDLPGVDAKSVDLTVEQNVLTVHSTRERSAPEGAELIVGERQYGTFTRQLFLGDALDTDRLEARYDAGVLIVRIPVAERAKPRRVEIGTGDSQSEAIEAHAQNAAPAHA